MALISKKKRIYPISDGLRNYLVNYAREVDIPIHYHELLRYTSSIALYDSKDQDTLWETVFYDQSDREEIHLNVKKIYALLKAGGDMSVMNHLYVDRIDLCIYGNTQPFRVRIVNRINDNFDYFYIKNADASRVYGLELEHLLSPNRISYLVHRNTLIEEHIAGIPGDKFMRQLSDDPNLNPIRLSKEFVKFNERCLVTLLGDMRSYNFVVQITPDFDDIQFRIRAIDFDQQFYEGNIKVYMPQFFKENYPLVKLCMEHLTEKTVQQYKQEELSSIVHRVRSERHRLTDLRDVSCKEELTTKENIMKLKKSMAVYYKNPAYEDCKNMTDIIELNLKNIIRQVKL